MNNKILKLLGLFPLVLATVLPLAAGAQPGDTNVIIVEQGVHKLFRESGGVTRVAVGNPEIADVNIINKREVLITGKQLGITSLMVWSRTAKAPREYRIRVGGVKDPLRTAMPDKELGKALIDQGRGLEGKLPNLLAHRRAKIAASTPKDGALADRSSIDLETQVMTEVKIAEINHQTLRRFGLKALLTRQGPSGGLFSPGTLTGVEMNAEANSGIVFNSGQPVQSAFNLVFGDPTKALLSTISILESRGLSRTLAEPSLTVTSGQTASYLAGGEFPVPVSQGGAQAGGITIVYKEFGVRLKLTPTVLARDRIALKVAPEVSDLDFSAGVQIGGVSVPALVVRRTDTTVELGDGESFVISGLISSNIVNNIGKVPWLADIPVLGAFFKSIATSREDKELIMIVTPHLVRPLARGARTPPLPGAQYDNYAPGAAHEIFMETGDYDSGFSR